MHSCYKLIYCFKDVLVVSIAEILFKIWPKQSCRIDVLVPSQDDINVQGHMSQGFQYFSSVLVLHYLQAVILIIKFEHVVLWISDATVFWLGGTNYHFKWVKVPDTAPY